MKIFLHDACALRLLLFYLVTLKYAPSTRLRNVRVIKNLSRDARSFFYTMYEQFSTKTEIFIMLFSRYTLN